MTIKPRNITFSRTYLFYKALIIRYLIYFQERSNLKSISKTQGPLTSGKKDKKWFEFQRKRLKSTIFRNPETKTWNILKLL